MTVRPVQNPTRSRYPVNWEQILQFALYSICKLCIHTIIIFIIFEYTLKLLIFYSYILLLRTPDNPDMKNKIIIKSLSFLTEITKQGFHAFNLRRFGCTRFLPLGLDLCADILALSDSVRELELAILDIIVPSP